MISADVLWSYEKMNESRFYAGKMRRGRFICNICSKTSYKKTDMTNHIEAHHLNHEYPCDICGRILRTKAARSVHIKQKHSILPKNN